MKIRNGFVSNSSTSSYIVNVMLYAGGATSILFCLSLAFFKIKSYIKGRMKRLLVLSSSNSSNLQTGD